MQRFGQVIGIDRKHFDEYERLHADAWPSVLSMIHTCNIRNYSIFRHGETLFAYFEYVGDDFETDMARMAADPETQRWWAVCKPMQRPLPDAEQDEWWLTMREVFHLD